MNAPHPFRAVGPLPDGHPTVKQGKIGVLLTNLGTPDGTDYWPMRRYLKEFLSDKRVIDTPRILWWPILNLIILSLSPQKKGKDYASIWNNEKNESLLKTITRDQSDKLQVISALLFGHLNTGRIGRNSKCSAYFRQIHQTAPG